MPSLSSLLAGLGKKRRASTDGKPVDHDQLDESQSADGQFQFSGGKQTRRRSWLSRRGPVTDLFRPGGTGKRGSRPGAPEPSEETLKGLDAAQTSTSHNNDHEVSADLNGNNQSTVTALVVSCRFYLPVFPFPLLSPHQICITI